MKYSKILGFCTLGLLLSCNVALAWLPTGELQHWSLPADWRPYGIAITLMPSGVYVIHDDVDPSDGLIGKVFHISPHELPVYETTPAHFQAIAYAWDFDNTLWITDNYWDAGTETGNRIWQFNPSEAAPFTDHALPADTFDLPADPYGVSVAPDGKVWFTCQNPDNPSIGWYDPATTDWQGYPLPLDRDPGVPVEIVFDADENVWFTIKEWAGAKPGFGRLQPDLYPSEDAWRLWLHGGGDSDFPADCLDTYGFTNCPRTPWEIAIVNGMVWYTDKTAACLVRYNPSDDSFACFSMPIQRGTPMDVHYFGVAPDDLFYLAAFGWNAIGIFDPLTETFAHLPLEFGSQPIGIAVDRWTLLPSGHVWVAETLAGLVGRFIPLPDDDNDGIPNEIDPQPNNDSNDTFIVGPEIGTIDRGDQEVSSVIIRRPLKGDRVRIFAGCPGDGDPAMEGAPASVFVPCEDPSGLFWIDACESFESSCEESLTARVQVGPILAELGGSITVTLPSGVEMTATEDASGALNITNSGNQGMFTVEYGGQTQVLGPGQSVCVIEPDIDIKPDSYPNSINLKSKSVVPVAVLTSDGFDATTVEPDTVVFAGAELVKWTSKDVDGDGDEDLLFYFKTQELALNQESVEATLNGITTDGLHIMATDSVNIVPKGKGVE